MANRKYLCRNRPPDSFNVPRGGLLQIDRWEWAERQENGAITFGTVTYSRRLTQAEISDHGLRPDSELERARLELELWAGDDIVDVYRGTSSGKLAQYPADRLARAVLVLRREAAVENGTP